MKGFRKARDRKPAFKISSALITHDFFKQTVDGFRTVVLTRPFKGLSDDHYTFDPVKTTTIPVIMASGKSLKFAYHEHKHRGGEPINLIASGAPTCVCNAGMSGEFNHDAKENKLT